MEANEPGLLPGETLDPRESYRPCVGIMLLDPARRVFVGERTDRPGSWQMPQGGIDPGEPPERAALRELKEEIGTDRATVIRASRIWRSYDLPIELQGRFWGGRWPGQSQLWLACRYDGRDDEIDLATPHPEFQAWRWASPADLVPLAVPFKRAVYDSLLREFADLLEPSAIPAS